MLVGESGILITKVLYTKKNKKNTFLIVDAGMNDLLRPALYDAYHDIQSVEKKSGKKIKYTIVGPICESADTFAKNKLLNKINTNELLFLKNVGAYGSSMSSSYNSRPIIMELIIYKNNFSIIRIVDTVINQISREKIPSWLSKIK
jgi:diaminopimelate decarboxylase